MKPSFFQSESGRHAALFATLLVAGVLVQLWMGMGWQMLLPLLPCVVAYGMWMRRMAPGVFLLGKVRVVAHDVAHGKFSSRLTHIPQSSEFGGLCWDMNDMLDQVETCFRDQATALQYAAEGKYFRRA